MKTFTPSKALSGGSIMSACLLIPMIGCFLAVTYNNTWWLALLIPLIVFMEGGLLLIGLAIAVVFSMMGN